MVKGFTPTIECSVDGRSITSLLMSRLVEASVTDGTGIDDDRLMITVDNPGDRIARPRKGAKVLFAGGYRETGIRTFGNFIVEDVEKSAPNRKLTIIARAGSPGNAIKEKRYASHEEKSIDDIVSEIAGIHGLTPAIGEDLASVVIPFRAQIGESDMHLLTSLGMRLGAVASIKDGYLIFARKGKAASVTGKPLPVVTIGMDDLYGEDAFLVRGTARNSYGTIRAFYHDRQQSNRRFVEVSSDGPLLQLPEVYQSEDEARTAIDGERNNRDRSEENLSVTIQGNITVQADAKLIVAGIDRDGDGEWSVETAEHSWSGSEIYQTTIEAVRKERE